MTSAISTRAAAQLQIPNVHVTDYLANIAVAASEITALQAGGLVADLTTTKGVVGGTASAGIETKAAKGDHVHPPTSVKWQYDEGDATAGATLAETAFSRIPAAATVASIKLTPTGAATASNTNYATIVIGWRDGVGGTLNTLCTLTTQVSGGGSWVAFTTKDMGTVTNAVLTAGAVLTASIAKAASGVQLPAFVVEPVFG